MRKVILASASPRRAAMLKNILANLSIVPSRVDESKITGKTAGDLAVKAAAAKAKEVGSRRKNAVVIGADTIVVLGRKILGKPKDAEDAVKMLKSLSGKVHKVITGLAILDTESHKLVTHQETTRVKMKKIPMNEITKYVETGSPLDKAGGYGIQEVEEMFIERIEGDYDNVVGLPIAALLKLLRALPPA